MFKDICDDKQMQKVAEIVLAEKLPESGFYVSGIRRITNDRKETTGWCAPVRVTDNNMLIGLMYLDANGAFKNVEATPV